jgi:hypothetical protein
MSVNIPYPIEELKLAVKDRRLTKAEVANILLDANKHPGGRPKGSKNKGLHKLDRAVAVLSLSRLDMTAEEYRRSEERIELMLTRTWRWKAILRRNADIKKIVAGLKQAIKVGAKLSPAYAALAQSTQRERDVVMHYKRSEARGGMGRSRRAKGIKRPGGPVVGFVSEPESFVERSLSVSAEPVTLWGHDVTEAVQEELGFERPPRFHHRGRRWLAPVRDTEIHHVGKRKLVCGVAEGRNGYEPVPVGGTTPTVGEQHEAALAENRVRGGAAYEADHRGSVEAIPVPAVYVTRVRRVAHWNGRTQRLLDAACIRPERELDAIWPAAAAAVKPKETLVLQPKEYRAPDNVPVPMPANVATHVVETEYITNETEDGKWAYGVSYAIATERLSGKVDPECLPEAQEKVMRAKRKAAGWPLPVLQPIVEGFLPKTVHVVHDRCQVGHRDHLACQPTSVVWSEAGEPLRGSRAWWRWRIPSLPIVSPQGGYVELFN